MNALIAALLLVCTLPITTVHAQDYGERDTVYYLTPTFKPASCGSTIRTTLPIRLFSDIPSTHYTAELAVTGTAKFSSFKVYAIAECDSTWNLSDMGEDSTNISLFVMCYSGGGVTPGHGTVLELIINSNPGDTIHVSTVEPFPFTLGDGFNFWYPLGSELDTTITIPSQFNIQAGDADASGSVAITDAVLIINYIFGGGCEPYDLNAADPNQTCDVTITDAVYLINYIFGGGAAPLPGCVVE